MKWDVADYCLLGLIAIFFSILIWFEDVMKWL